MVRMRHPFLSSILLLWSLTLPCLAQNSQPPGVEGITDPNMVSTLIDYWADYACYSLSDNSEPNIKEQCKEACFPGGITSDVPPEQTVQSSQTCWLNGPESDYSSGKPLTDEQKNENPRTVKSIKTGYCICDDPIINILGDFFIKSVIEIGKILEKVMCPTLMALDLVVEIGSAAIPGVGKAITIGMKTGIKTAKMYKYAYDAQEAAMEWASMFVEQGFGLASEAGCKASFSFSKADLAKRFLEFADAPDELIPGINYDEMPCPKGKKASKKCKEKNGESDDDKSPSITEDNSQPTQASNQPSTAKNEPSQTNNQPSSTTTDTGPTAKVDCAAIGREDLETLFETIPDEEEGGLVEKRTVGTTLQSRRLEPRNLKAKPGRTCKGFAGEQLGGGELKSKKYPTAGDSLMNDAPAYGFNIVDDCSDYGFGVQKTRASGAYHTEHVLEWSMVTDFFTTMNNHADFEDGFLHPDPDQATRLKDPGGSEKIENIVNFCEYSTESWNWTDNSDLEHFPKMKNPDPTAPAPAEGEVPFKQKPLEWFQEAYPFQDGRSASARKAHEDEFILLQRRINEIAKNGMFSDSQIYKQKDMSDLIKRKSKDKHKNGRKKGQVKWPDPNQQPRVAIQRMRSVVGALLYMTNNKVNQIFVNQVDRIGAQLDNIENALPKTPRTKMKKVKGADNKEVEITVTFNKWEHLDLKKKWFDYMDGVYTRANDKANAFMKTNFKELNDEYDSKKMIKQDDINKEKDKDKQKKMKEEKKLRDDMKDYIAKLETEWTKANNWSKPKWNSKTPEAGT